MLLEGKNALITGAARGIGAAMVEVFAREGANVWAFARTPDARFEARLAMAAGKYGVWIKPVYCELTDTAALREAFRQVMADKQPLHVLVNNAGIMGEDRMFQMTSAEDMRRIMDVNFFAMVEVSRLATRLMARNKCGAVVNIASVAGIEGDSRLDYSASKAAVIAATKKMARELISVGIRVNALAPGFTDTDLVSGLSEKVTQEQLGRILMHRKARPEEIAGVAAFLASDMASYVTGQAACCEPASPQKTTTPSSERSDSHDESGKVRKGVFRGAGGARKRRARPQIRRERPVGQRGPHDPDRRAGGRVRHHGGYGRHHRPELV